MDGISDGSCVISLTNIRTGVVAKSKAVGQALIAVYIYIYIYPRRAAKLRFRHRAFSFPGAIRWHNDSASIGMVPRRFQRGSERPRCTQDEKTSPAKSFVKKISNYRQPTAFPVFEELGSERLREAQRGSERLREAQRGSERLREAHQAQKGLGLPKAKNLPERN